jgi:hypothetical protein
MAFGTSRSLEEIMKKIATGAAALVLGATFCSVPAFAQRNANDGGQVTVAPGAKPAAPAAKSTTATTPYYGRGANDGGTGPQPTGAQASAESSQSKSSGQKPATPPAPGRNPNDGGTVQ